MATARSRLPFTVIYRNGVSLGDGLIFGSGQLQIEKEIPRKVTVGGISRRVVSVSASGSFNLDGDVAETVCTSHENSGSTPGNQDLIQIHGVMIAGVITASYDRNSDMTQCQFQGTLPEIDDLGGMGIVDGTLGGAYYEGL